MKYIYQKRTLHSFPDYLKLKKATCIYSYRFLVSLSPLRRDLLVVVSSRPTYSIGYTLLYVPGKNVYSKDGGSWIGIIYEKHKKEYL